MSLPYEFGIYLSFPVAVASRRIAAWANYNTIVYKLSGYLVISNIKKSSAGLLRGVYKPTTYYTGYYTLD